MDSVQRRAPLLPVAALAALLGALTLWEDPWRWAFSRLFPQTSPLIYPLGTFPELLGEHLLLVLLSSGLATAVGVAAGILVTRPWGREFLPAADALSSIGQTFPPVAVLAVAVPVFGFGFRPTVLALFLYGLMPILRNTVAGLGAVDRAALEAARGMGMTPAQVLLRVELPLAAPVVLAGVRLSAVINTGTAALGATIGAGGLGKPIVAGLVGDNPAYLLEGAVLVGLLAVLIDAALGLAADQAAPA